MSRSDPVPFEKRIKLDRQAAPVEHRHGPGARCGKIGNGFRQDTRGGVRSSAQPEHRQDDGADRAGMERRALELKGTGESMNVWVLAVDRQR